MNIADLPSKIRVKIMKVSSGTFVAELPEFDLHTESDSRSGLDYMINDVVYAYFEVPKKYWGKVWYKPLKFEPTLSKKDIEKLLVYKQFTPSGSNYSAK